MSKPHMTKGMKCKRAATAFKSEWLDEVVETRDSRNAKPSMFNCLKYLLMVKKTVLFTAIVEMQKQQEISQPEKFGMMSGNWTF